MDATIKRSRWKLAIIHFALTLIVCMSLMHSGWSGPPGERMERWMALQNFKIGSLILLQPQLGILFAAAKYCPTVLANYFSWVPSGLLMAVWFISIPIWSICFGWIFAKLDNWLNHFPVLGKRVF